MNSTFKKISIDRLIDPERPMRSNLTPESVTDLVSSIKQVGIIEPLVVVEKGENYEVVAGHRRLLAAEVLRLTVVPCLIIKANALDAEMLKLHENLARSEINAIDWAKHIDYLKRQYHVTNAKIAELLGVSEAWVGQHLDILNYAPELHTALQSGKLSFSAARELAQIKDPRKRDVYTKHAVRGGVTPGLAAQWRKEANRSAYLPPDESNDTLAMTAEGLAELALPQCPVCQVAIQPQNHMTIVIHDYCSPATAI